MGVNIGTLTAVSKLDDQLSGPLAGLGQKAGVALGAVGAFALKAGNDYDRATRTIAEGTGATGDKLAELQESFRNLAGTIPGVGSPAVASAIADLNTHLALTGGELESVAAKALKAGVDTNRFGGVAKQLGLDADGATKLLDDMAAASQKTGADVNVLVNAIAKGSPRWLAAGGDMEGLTATVVQAADEFGPAGLRGAMSEILQEVDRGVIPAFRSLDDQLGDTTGTVERAYESAIPFSDRLTALKDRALAMIGPFGNAAGSVASVTSALVLAGPQIASVGATIGTKLLPLLAGPVGLVAVLGTALVGAIVAAQGSLRELHSNIQNFSNLTEQQMMQAITDVDERIRGLRESMDLYGDALGETSGEIAELEADKQRMIAALNEARTASKEVADVQQEAVVPSLLATSEAAKEAKTDYRDLTASIQAAHAEMENAQRIADITVEQVDFVAGEWQKLGPEAFEKAAPGIEQTNIDWGEIFKEGGTESANLFTDSLQGLLQGRLPSIGGLISGFFDGIFGGISSRLSSLTGSIGGGAGGIGGALSGALPGLAAAGLAYGAQQVFGGGATSRYTLEDTQRRFPGAGQGGGGPVVVVEIDGREVARATGNSVQEEGW